MLLNLPNELLEKIGYLSRKEYDKKDYRYFYSEIYNSNRYFYNLNVKCNRLSKKNIADDIYGFYLFD